MDATHNPSTALAAANQKLLQRRALLAASQPATRSNCALSSYRLGTIAATSLETLTESSAQSSNPSLAQLPPHLGWGSTGLTAVLRAAERSPSNPRPSLPVYRETERTPVSTPRSTANSHDVRLYPDLTVAMLRQRHSSDGRVWLLLRHLDQDGRGWIPRAVIEQHLTAPESAWRLFGKRQLRNVLHQGEGIFWQQTKERLWLLSVARVAASLGVRRLRQRPVWLAAQKLCGSLREVNAHFFASFHSSRDRRRPISRETLTTITGIPARTQRAYERLAGTAVHRHIALGAPATTSNVQERAWRHGRALFTFTDFLGKQGRRGRQYIAWHLPNSYSGSHRPAPKGRLRKINQCIDLVTTRARGNDALVTRVFFPDGAGAGKAAGRQSASDKYWPAQQAQGGTQLWYVLPPSSSK